MTTDDRSVADFATTSDHDANGNVPDIDALDADTPDALLDVLSDSRRRFVVACLREYATPMALADVADELATWEHDAPLREIPEEEVATVYMSLYHVHVPKLADAGLVEYSQDRDVVALTGDGDEIPAFVPLPSVG